MSETTRPQDAVIEELANRYGRVAVRGMDRGRVLVVGMIDDIEMCHLVVAADGLRRPAGPADFERFGPTARKPLRALFEPATECCPACGRPIDRAA